MTVHDLPAVNASLNGLSAIFLTAATFSSGARTRPRTAIA
jgi:hypothetical protein